MRDGDFVVGWDEAAPAFFWLAAQGGYGIQTAAAASELAAALVERQPVPDALRAHGVDALAMRPPPALIPFPSTCFPDVTMTAITRYPSTLPLPFSRATRAGGFLFLSGQIPMDADGRSCAATSASRPAAIARIKDTLALANASLADVVRVTVWLTDLAQFADFNEAYRQHFPADFPRSTVEAGWRWKWTWRSKCRPGSATGPDFPQAFPRAPASRTLQTLDMEWQHEDLFRFPGNRNQYLFPIPTGLGAYRARRPASILTACRCMPAAVGGAQRARQGLDAGRRPDRRRHAGRHHHAPRL